MRPGRSGYTRDHLRGVWDCRVRELCRAALRAWSEPEESDAGWPEDVCGELTAGEDVREDDDGLLAEGDRGDRSARGRRGGQAHAAARHALLAVRALVTRSLRMGAAMRAMIGRIATGVVRIGGRVMTRGRGHGDVRSVRPAVVEYRRGGRRYPVRHAGERPHGVRHGGEEREQRHEADGSARDTVHAGILTAAPGKRQGTRQAHRERRPGGRPRRRVELP